MTKLKIAPVLLILFGGIFLLNNLGILPWDIWTSLWKFWPVILILIGIEFLLGQALSLKTIIILLALVFILPIIIAVNPITNNPLSTEEIEISENLGALTKAKVIIDLPATNLSIKESSSSAKLVEGKISYSKASEKPEIAKEESFGQAIFSITQNTRSGLPFISSLRNNTQLFLNQQIPIELQIKTGASKEEIDLSSLRIDLLEINSQASDLKIIFGDSYSSRVKIKSSASSLKITIPENIPTRLKINSKVKNLTVGDRFDESDGEYKTDGFDKAFTRLDIQVEAVAGSITIN